MEAEHVCAEVALSDLLGELDAATQRLDRLLDHSITGPQAAELVSVRDAVMRAYRTLDTQDVAVRELTDSVRTLARRLLETHAQFSEWMLSTPRPGRGGPSR